MRIVGRDSVISYEYLLEWSGRFGEGSGGCCHDRPDELVDLCCFPRHASLIERFQREKLSQVHCILFLSKYLSWEK